MLRLMQNPVSNNELAFKKHGDESLGGGKNSKYNQTLQNYLKVSTRIDVFVLTEDDRIKITGTTLFKTPKIEGYLL